MSGMERYQTPEVEALARREIPKVMERMTREQRIAERTRDLMGEIVSVELHPINLDPYPASVGEVADEIARYVLELEASGVARGLAAYLFSRLADVQSKRDEEAAVHAAEAYPDPYEAF